MTYLVVRLVVLITGLVIENVLRGPEKATRTGSHAVDGGQGASGGGQG